MSLKERVEKELSVLIKQPILRIERAGNMFVFEFGRDIREVRFSGKDRGKEIATAEYRMQVHCPWRILSQGRLVTGYLDFLYMQMPDGSFAKSDDSYPNLQDQRIHEWLTPELRAGLTVARVTADEIGGLEIRLEPEVQLQIFPADSVDDEYQEYWRFQSKRPSKYLVTAARGIIEGVPQN